MRNKSFVHMLEMIMVVMVLYFAFSIFFPGFSYKSRWSEAFLLQTARDSIVTADRIGKLYEYSNSRSSLQNFLNKVISNESMISWSENDGAIKSQIVLACNCTNSQMNNLNAWMSGLTINGRSITTVPCYTNLESINPCIDSSDVLVIWGQKDLSNPIYSNTLKEYLKTEGGLFEIADFTSQLDAVQTDIFGLKDDGTVWGSPDYDIINKPETANNITYQAYKIYVNALKGNSTITEFCKHLVLNKKIIPADGDKSKVLFMVDKDQGQALRPSCVIFNSTRIAWMGDFTVGPSYDSNHTKLFASLLLATSNKRVKESSVSNIRTGYMTSYINVKNDEMFEVYRFDLGLGYPY